DLVDMDSYHYTIDGFKATSTVAQLGCPYQSFTGKTKIIVGDSPNKRAMDVKLGDKLIGFDEKSKALVETTVSHVFKYEADELYRIYLANGKTIDVTPEHPFYIRGEWIEVKDIK